MLAYAHCMFYYFQYACGRHRITPEILIKMKFGSLISNEVAQNKVVRFILNLKAMTRIDYSVLSYIYILKVEDWVKQLRLNHVYNIFHELAPQYLNQNFKSIRMSFVQY